MMQSQVDKWQNQLIQTDELLLRNAQDNTKDIVAYVQQAQRLTYKYAQLGKMQAQLEQIAKKLGEAHDLTYYTAENLVEATADLQVLQRNRQYHKDVFGMRAALLERQQYIAQTQREALDATSSAGNLRRQATEQETEAGRILATAQRKLQEQQ